MGVLERDVKAEKIMRMLNARLDHCTLEYTSSKYTKDEVKAAAMAETKWQLAELKMQFVTILIEQIESEPENVNIE